MEHYSTLDEGALYRFNWIFPSQKLHQGRDRLRRAASSVERRRSETFAYLDDDLIDAKIVDELRDHPLLLLPRREAARADRSSGCAVDRPPELRPADYLMRGDLSHRNRQIFEALLSSYHGDLGKVLRHVQVERFYVSRRYRQAAATVEPQLAVDARSRQLTMDRSLASLPPALQSLTLYEYQGELVDGNRGVIDFADLLKRPLEAYKYLLGTVEQGRVSLDVASLELDTVFIGSSNEGYLAAFKEIPEFQSFKGRIELVRVPYLLDYRVGAADLRGADPGRGRRVGQARRAARRLGGRAVGGADPDEEAAGREVPQGAGRPRRQAGRRWRRPSSTPTAPRPRGSRTEQQRELLARHRQDRARVGRLPELRGAHRRLAARDEAAAHERGAEHASTRACRRSRCSTSWRSWSGASPSTSS